MKKRALRKDFHMEIKKSLNRFLSIFFIVALGVAFFSGIQASAPDMRLTGDRYLDDADFCDLRILGTYGLTEEDIEELSALPGIEEAEAGYMTDVLWGSEGNREVLHVESLFSRMNQPTVKEGRLPEKDGECFLDDQLAQEGGYAVGDVLEFFPGEDEDDYALKSREYTICGIGTSPMYISFNRGSSTLGNGEVSGFALVAPEAFDQEVYTLCYASVAGARELTAWQDSYDELVENVADQAESIADVRCEARFAEIQDEAAEKLEEGKEELEQYESELEDAKVQLADGKQEAKEELTSARHELKDGMAQVADAKETLAKAREELESGESELADGQRELREKSAELADARSQLDEGWSAYYSGYSTLAQNQAEYDAAYPSAKAELDANSQKLADGKAQLESGAAQYAAGAAKISQAREELESGKAQLESGRSEYETQYEKYAAGAAQYESGLAELTTKESELEAGVSQYETKESEYAAGLSQYETKESEYAAGLAQYETKESEYTAGVSQYETKESEYAAGLAQYETKESEYAAGVSQYETKESEYAAGQAAYAAGESEYAAGLAAYEEKLAEYEEGETAYQTQADQLAASWAEYQGKADAFAQLETSCNDGQAAYDAGMAQYNASVTALEASRAELENTRGTYNEAAAALNTLQTELAGLQEVIAAGTATEEDTVRAAALEAELIPAAAQNVSALEASLAAGQAQIDQTQAGLDAAKAELDGKKAELDGAWAQLEANRPDLEAGKAELDNAQAQLDGYRTALDAGKAELDSAKAELDGARAELDTTKAALEAGRTELDGVKATLEAGRTELDGAKAELEAGRTELDSAKATLEAGRTELDSAKATLETGRTELDGAKATLEAGRTELDSAKATLEAGRTELEAGKAELNGVKSQLDSAKTQLDGAKAQLDASEQEIAQGEGQLTSEEAKLTEAKAQLDASEQEIAQGEAQLAAGYGQLSSAKSQLDSGWAQVNSSRETLESMESQYKDGADQLEEGRQTLLDGQKELDDGRKEYSDGLQELEEKEQELLDGWKEYKEGKREARLEIAENEEKLADGEEKIAEAKEKIADGEEEIAGLKMPEWYVSDRSAFAEYTGYGENAERITNIGKVFPVIFFLVAALISLTTMTRMVEEQRVQIGTLKALGYGKAAIAGKYLKYALLATLGGGVFGIIIGEKVIPYIIVISYGIMYPELRNVVMPYEWTFSLMAIGAALICTLGAALSSCAKELAATPAVLMRPPAPKQGKRVLLEYFPFIWKRLGFIWKSTVRNLFRYKKRFLMTVFGISGCMGLLLVGFGIRDSIMNIGSLQYEQLQLYQGLVILDPDAGDAAVEEVRRALKEDTRIADAKEVYMKKVSFDGEKKNGDVYLFVPEDTKELERFVVLRDRESGRAYDLAKEGVILTEKAATLSGVKAGETISLTEDEQVIRVTVSAICENYMSHYLYMTPEAYQEAFGKAPEYTGMAFVVEEPGEEQEKAVGESLLELDGVLNVTYTSSIAEQLDRMLSSLDMVIAVLIVSAGMLAFVVLYNLNNININERRRELATLKVLGFYDGEVSAYVYRENVLLTLIGAVAGCGVGVLLHRFIIVTVEVDACMFGRNIEPASFLYSILFTVGFSAFVNFVMHFKLKKIDMVESLKSVE